MTHINYRTKVWYFIKNFCWITVNYSREGRSAIAIFIFVYLVRWHRGYGMDINLLFSWLWAVYWKCMKMKICMEWQRKNNVYSCFENKMLNINTMIYKMQISVLVHIMSKNPATSTIIDCDNNVKLFVFVCRETFFFFV